MPALRPARRTPAVPTASMADIGFLLLVFFLVVTSLSSDAGLPATLPSAHATGAPAGPRLEVQVRADGAVAVAGERLGAAELRARVAAWAPSRRAVLLHAERAAPYAAYVAALDAVRLGHRDAGVAPRLALHQPAR